jgi:hypothetical protein
MLEAIPSFCIVDNEGCRRNAESALRRGLPTCGWGPKRTGQLAIVGSGPSVRDHLDELRSWSGEIWATNGAYRFLLDNGIVPHAFVGLDPVPGLKEYVERRDEQTTFLMSSVCDPCVFDELSDADVYLWHSKQGDFSYPEGSCVVGGGTTCLTRMPYLAHLLGWRDMTMFGADSSFTERNYCYENRFAEDTDRPRFPVVVNGQEFVSELSLIKQVSVFGVMQTLFNGRLKFKCGGLLDAFLKSPIHDPADFNTA